MGSQRDQKGFFFNYHKQLKQLFLQHIGPKYKNINECLFLKHLQNMPRIFRAVIIPIFLHIHVQLSGNGHFPCSYEVIHFFAMATKPTIYTNNLYVLTPGWPLGWAVTCQTPLYNICHLVVMFSSSSGDYHHIWPCFSSDHNKTFLLTTVIKQAAHGTFHYIWLHGSTPAKSQT